MSPAEYTVCHVKCDVLFCSAAEWLGRVQCCSQLPNLCTVYNCIYLCTIQVGVMLPD